MYMYQQYAFYLFLDPLAVYTSLGMQGCKNERDGGEGVVESDDGPFLVYYVFRSFRRPSNAPLLMGCAV